jgi:hypothetical protein
MPENAAKSRFLVVYDYGQGGVWAFVWARSVDEIHEKFRDLQVGFDAVLADRRPTGRHGAADDV